MGGHSRTEKWGSGGDTLSQTRPIPRSPDGDNKHRRGSRDRKDIKDTERHKRHEGPKRQKRITLFLNIKDGHWAAVSILKMVCVGNSFSFEL